MSLRVGQTSLPAVLSRFAAPRGGRSVKSLRNPKDPGLPAPPPALAQPRRTMRVRKVRHSILGSLRRALGQERARGRSARGAAAQTRRRQPARRAVYLEFPPHGYGPASERRLRLRQSRLAFLLRSVRL